MKKIITFIIAMMMFINILDASIDIKARSAIVIDSDTNKVLYEKNSDIEYAPASMTKMMTLLIAMEEINKGNLSLDEEVVISKNASEIGGSQIYLEEGKTIKVEDLLMSIAVGSANDSATVLAERIGGSVNGFATLMNKKAKEIGANNTTFKNPHGLDQEGHLTTARDMAIIASHLVKYTDIFKYTSTYETTIKHANGKSIWLVNTNSLIKHYDGIDGLKTGYTDNAKYCLTSTIKKNNMRIIVVVMGEETKEDRTTDTVNLIEWVYANFQKETLINSDKALGKIFIDNANNRSVDYYLERDVSVVIDKDTRDIDYSYDIELFDKKAPLKKDEVIGKLYLNYDNSSVDYNIVVKQNVKKANFFVRAKNYLCDLVGGNINLYLIK